MAIGHDHDPRRSVAWRAAWAAVNLLEAHAAQSIWITELGYSLQPGLHLHVSPNDHADYWLGAFQRVRTEWPWVGMFTINVVFDDILGVVVDADYKMLLAIVHKLRVLLTRENRCGARRFLPHL